MHPNVFLKTFWRMELKPQVFVAMSFDPKYDNRFEKVYQPACQALSLLSGAHLDAHRVDLSKTGDSILTEIMDGVAHSQLILADISVLGRDKASDQPYRNGNVMYELGLALACRQPTEVLIVRDDYEKLLFDVSTIPHKSIDFSDTAEAKHTVHKLLQERLSEQKYFLDARIDRVVSTLTKDEISVMSKAMIAGEHFFMDTTGSFAPEMMSAVPRLLDKQVIRYNFNLNGKELYSWTELGKALFGKVENLKLTDESLKQLGALAELLQKMASGSGHSNVEPPGPASS